MPAALAREAVLVLPSIVAEALPRVMLEAMAAGLVVVGTTTGGTGEVLRDGETGLTFRAGDAADLARQIERLAGDPELRARLAAAGRKAVRRDFSIDRTVDQLEALLCQIARQHEVATA
jgi:2-deoxystreptamine N-acetyl-D-glucosaminyltransferase/2-deoxystreptamine glucosyltransferase